MGEVRRIYADERALAQLKEALATAGEDYKRNLNRLTNLVRQITEGDIRGDLATDFKNKFEAKEETLKKLQTSIDEAESYMGMKREDLVSTVTNTQSEMK